VLLLAHGAAGAAPTAVLVALSPQTGAVEPGFPRVAGSAVLALSPDGRGGWYVGGAFARIGGVTCANLAHVLPDRRVDRRWCPRPNGAVRAMVRSGDRLFVGGENVTRVAGRRRRNLAAFDIPTGKLLPWSPGAAAAGGGSGYAAVYGMSASPDGAEIFVSGLFDRLGGATRHNLGSVRASDGRATAFAPNPDTNLHGDSVDAFAVTSQFVYAWGYYNRIGGHRASRSGADVLARHTGGWVGSRPSSDGGPYSTAVVGRLVYAGGVISRLGGAERDDLAAFDGATGAVTPWAPRTGPKLVVEAIGAWHDTIVAALTASHWDPGPRRLVAYSTGDGRALWRSTVTVGSVNVIAADARTILVGG
jgi:hypothetical protein